MQIQCNVIVSLLDFKRYTEHSSVSCPVAANVEFRPTSKMQLSQLASEKVENIPSYTVSPPDIYIHSIIFDFSKKEVMLQKSGVDACKLILVSNNQLAEPMYYLCCLIHIGLLIFV
jgi:hypothetical protein